VLVQQRLATRQAHLAHAEPRSHARNLENLVIAEALLLPQKLVVCVEFVLGHAVRAAKIALVEHGDTQVMQRPAQGIAYNCNI
jgi:hypothetical protein